MNKKFLLQLLVVLPFLGAAQIKASGKIYNDSSKNIYIVDSYGSLLTPYPGLAANSSYSVSPNQN